jgi:cellulose synthase/poly-beta-1,6-N-acetylglucosamine synthase-like glycosyltransferase
MAMAAMWAAGLALAGLVYVYVGFPVLLAVVGTLRNRRHRQEPITPSVSIVIAAYNEEACIEARIANALAADYPRDCLEVIVASDGSTDRTDEVVAAFPDPRVILLSLPRRGKVAALNDAVLRARGDILVFSDANTMADPRALRALARNFADAGVGGVVGHTGYSMAAGMESSGRGESLYWRYDTWIKKLESRTGGVVSAHGGLYAIRRELYQAPGEAAATDDFMISTAVVAQGYRLVFEPDARAVEAVVPSADLEFHRRVRLMTRGLRAVAARAELLNPFRYRFYAIVLLSHKVLRRIAFVPLLVLFAAAVVLSITGPVTRVAHSALSAQILFLGAALLGHQLRRRAIGHWRLLFVPFFYCMANAAAGVAVVRFLRGERIVTWNPQRHGSQPVGQLASDGSSVGPPAFLLPPTGRP